VLSWGSFPSELSPLRFGVRSLASTHAGSSRPHSTCATGRPAIAVAYRDLDSDAWAREPRIRRYAESREPRASPSGSDPAHRRPREPSRAPAASPILTPCRECSDGASCPCPLSAAPRASLPFTAVSPEGAPAAGPRRRSYVEPCTSSAPCEASWRPGPSRNPIWSPVTGWTSARLTFASRTSSRPAPFARSRSVVGPPVARWAGSLGLSSLVESGSEVRACERCRAYSPFGSDPFEPE